MLRTPFHLPHGIALIADPVWIGEVSYNQFESAERKYSFEIGTQCGIITEWWSEPDHLNNIRDNLLAPPNPKWTHHD